MPEDREARELELELQGPFPSVETLYAAADRNIVQVLEVFAEEGLHASCRRGCDACCHQAVLATMAEAEAAARHLMGGGATAIGWQARLETWLEGTRDLRTMLQGATEDNLEDTVDGMAARYWDRRPPCPFLSEGSCSIHPVRPLACRHHFSLSPPERCAEGGAGAIEQMEAMEDAFFLAQDAIPEDQAEIGLFPELVALCLRQAPGSQDLSDPAS